MFETNPALAAGATALPVELPNLERFYFSGGRAVIAIHVNANGTTANAAVLTTTKFAQR